MRLSSSSLFDRSLYKLVKKDRKYKARVEKTLEHLVDQAMSNSLRLHKLSGSDNFSISVDMDIRIVFSWDRGEILLLNIGKHEDVY